MRKKNIVVLFGGQSSEHEVSCVSASTIIKHINQQHYVVIPVGITKEGAWYYYKGSLEGITNGQWIKDGVQAFISPDAKEKSLYIFDEHHSYNKLPIDIVFPALHGLYGEDGSIQGLLELAQIPYVGCNILSSSVAMDKYYTKIIVDRLSILQAKSLMIRKDELEAMSDVVHRIEASIPYPLFIKPSNAGSSVGITKAHNREELITGLIEAEMHDDKLLIEEAVKGREIECAVLGNKEPRASGLGEIIPNAEFYDYNAKYVSQDSKTVINPDIPKNVERKIRDYSVRIFKALDCRGLARVDFFVDEQADKIIFNEINTLPGFTSISMYPMLWEAKGIAKDELVDKLIQLAALDTRK